MLVDQTPQRFPEHPKALLHILLLGEQSEGSLPARRRLHTRTEHCDRPAERFDLIAPVHVPPKVVRGWDGQGFTRSAIVSPIGATVRTTSVEVSLSIRLPEEASSSRRSTMATRSRRFISTGPVNRI